MDEEKQMWDDSLIIDAYDRTMDEVNKRVEKQLKIDAFAAAAAANLGEKPDETLAGPASKSPLQQSLLPRSSLPQSSTSQVQPVESVPIVEQSTGQKSSTKECGENEPVWKKGDFCQALYEEDLLLYEAIIVAVEEDGRYRIRYLGYDNEEIKSPTELRPSLGGSHRRAQEKQALEEQYAMCSTGESDEFESNKAQVSYRPHPPNLPKNTAPHPMFDPSQAFSYNPPNVQRSGFLIPPPPSSLPPMESVDENELLTTTLMSWYMSGYHTGYYQAIRDLKGAK